ncbi:MAG: RNA methyltransferase [Rhodoferax sp.]|nr:RNA methyltransferase [Rhodoferax sp.]
MDSSNPVFVTSRNNPLFKQVYKLAHDNSAYRKAGRFWVEGEHLCQAALQRAAQPVVALYAESLWGKLDHALKPQQCKQVVLPDALFQDISALESPAQMGFVLDLPSDTGLQASTASVILDRVQDAGNVGSILRSAAAFGFGQVLALKGTAGLWSSKVLRAGMGAHFGLHLLEGLDVSALKNLAVPLVVSSSHQGQLLQDLHVPHPCAWVMGHEGQGIRAELLCQATLSARIGQPGGEESLNVAAAAAICLHASYVGFAS